MERIELKERRTLHIFQNISKVIQYVLNELLSSEQYLELAYYLAVDWDSDGIYFASQFVKRDAAIYKRKTDMETGEPWDPEDYILLGYYVNGNFEPVDN